MTDEWVHRPVCGCKSGCMHRDEPGQPAQRLCRLGIEPTPRRQCTCLPDGPCASIMPGPSGGIPADRYCARYGASERERAPLLSGTGVSIGDVVVRTAAERPSGPGWTRSVRGGWWRIADRAYVEYDPDTYVIRPPGAGEPVTRERPSGPGWDYSPAVGWWRTVPQTTQGYACVTCGATGLVLHAVGGGSFDHTALWRVTCTAGHEVVPTPGAEIHVSP